MGGWGRHGRPICTRRRVRAFVAHPCSPQREEQREYPIEAASTERVPHVAMDRRGCLDGPDGATSSTRHVRAERKQGAPSPGELKSGLAMQCGTRDRNRGAPWYAMRDSRALEEAHTRRRNGRNNGGRRGRWRRFRCWRGRRHHCADARAAMDRTTKSRREYSSSTPPVEPVRLELPRSAVRPSCDVSYTPKNAQC